MILNTWPYSEQDLTIHSNSLIALTYFHLGQSGKLIHEDKIHHASRSLFETLPILSQGNHSITGVENIIEYYRKENFGLEYDLPTEKLIKMKTYIHFIESQILPALNWYIWQEPHVYELTKKYFKESLNSYLSPFYIYGYRSEILNCCRYSQLELSHTSKNQSDDSIGQILYDRCKVALTALSHILENEAYFLGDKPTAADAFVFGRLAPFLIMNFNLIQAGYEPHGILRRLYECPNLINHCKRIQELCYPKANNVFKDTLNQKGIIPTSNSKWFKPGLRDGAIFAAFVISAFLIYANSVGIIHFGIIDSNEAPNEAMRHRKNSSSNSRINKTSNNSVEGETAPVAPMITISKLVEEAQTF